MGNLRPDIETGGRHDWTVGMGKKLPKLKPREVKSNLKALGFSWKRTDGSHETWERAADSIITERKIVTVDVGKTQFDDYLMKMMIRQSGCGREAFCTGVMDESAATPVATTVPAPAKSTKGF